jgi:hypothetical protein
MPLARGDAQRAHRFTDLGQPRSINVWRQFIQTKPLNLGGAGASNLSRYVINQE